MTTHKVEDLVGIAADQLEALEGERGPGSIDLALPDDLYDLYDLAMY